MRKYVSVLVVIHCDIFLCFHSILFFFFSVYLSDWVGSRLRCMGSWSNHAGSFLAVRGTNSLCLTGSVVAVWGLGCSGACGIPVPRQGWKLSALHCKTTGPPGKSHSFIFIDFFLINNIVGPGLLNWFLYSLWYDVWKKCFKSSALTAN